MPIQLESLKHELEKKYHQLSQNDDASSKLLTDILRFFKIPVDETRISDYQITEINFKELSISVIDTKTGTTHTSNYSNDSEVLGIIAYEEVIKFINVCTYNSLCEKTTVYYIGSETPILEKIRLHHNGYSLLFRKSLPNVINGVYRQDGTQFMVVYSKEVGKDEINLFTHIYKNGYTFKPINSFERILIHNSIATFNKNRPDHFCFDIAGDIVIGNKFSNDSLLIEGACFSIIDDTILVEALMNTFNPLKDYSNYNTMLVSSAILYAGHTYFNGKRHYHELEIGKTNDGISIKYCIKDRMKCPTPTIIQEVNYIISPLCPGSINIGEIESIITDFQNRFATDNFILFVLEELVKFKARLAIRNGLQQEIFHSLSPKLLIDTPFAEISDIVTSNKESYFHLAEELFMAMTNVSDTPKRGEPRKFKPQNLTNL